MAVMKYGKNGVLEIVTKTEIAKKSINTNPEKSEKPLKTTQQNKKGEAKNAR